MLSFFEQLIFATTKRYFTKFTIRCDLLSFFEQLIFATTEAKTTLPPMVLWFAFILWTTDICNNLAFNYNIKKAVVICFHSLNNWYLQQRSDSALPGGLGCDLLSFFEQLIFATTLNVFYTFVLWLWFAFILWTTDICNNRRIVQKANILVVICFHSLNNWYLQQLFIRL